MEPEWIQTSLCHKFEPESIQRVKAILRENVIRNREKRRIAAEEALRKAEDRKTLKVILDILTKECPSAIELMKKLQAYKNGREILKKALGDWVIRWKVQGVGRRRQIFYYLPYWLWEFTIKHSEYYFPEIAKAVTELEETIITHERRKQEERAREWQQKGHFPLAIRKPELWHTLIRKIENANPP